MNFLILSILIVGAVAQFPNPMGGKQCGNKEVIQKMKSRVAELRENIDKAGDACCQSAKEAKKNSSPIGQSSKAKETTEYAKKAYDICKEMQTDKEKITKQMGNMPSPTCVTDVESNNNQLATTLLPFSQLTGSNPDSAWEKFCGADAQAYGSCLNMTSAKAKGPTTKIIYKYLENIETDLGHMEKCEDCKPQAPIGN